MPSSGEERRRFAWRPLIRSLHRDMGYLSIGLTLVYAISGLAVNHIADWDPNFTSTRTVSSIPAPLTGSDRDIAATVASRLGIRGPVAEIYRAAPDRLDARVGGSTLHIDPVSGRVVQESQRSRFFLRVANWLHVARGKKEWLLFADAYAIGLLFLAISGMFMLPGKYGMRGRGAILAGIGAGVPLLYVVLSGGPR